jgi:hypothetical protein
VKRHRPGRGRRGNEGRPSPALVPPDSPPGVTVNAEGELEALVARARRTESLIADKRELPVFGALVRDWESGGRPSPCERGPA